VTASTPLVSVIMAAWNGEPYIRAAMASVLAQSMSDLELIVVNDGSTDATARIVEALQTCDDRVRLINRANSGRPGVARNDGIAAARGRYLSFLDCDDLYDEARTALLLEGLDAHPHWVAAFHDLRLIESDGSDIPGSYLRDADFLRRAADDLTAVGAGWYASKPAFFVFQSLDYAAMHTQSVLIATDRVQKETLYFDPDLVICEDTDLWIRLGMAGEIGYLDRVLSSYRQHSTSLTTDVEMRCGEMVKMHSLNYARIHDRASAAAAGRYRDKIARLAADLGYARYRKDDSRGARAAYALSLRWRWSRTSALGFAKACLPVAVSRSLRR
jgi:glycosyltransferase involved in cell wall biosynthesis